MTSDASARPPAAPAEAPLSPCIGLCRIDAASGLCSGCLRSLDEIALWSQLSNPQRAKIMAGLSARKTG